FDGGDFGSTNRVDRRLARTCRFAVDQNSAGATLCQPAAEFCAVERKIVAQDVKQRRVWVGVGSADITLSLATDGHGASPMEALAGRPTLGSILLLLWRAVEAFCVAPSR